MGYLHDLSGFDCAVVHIARKLINNCLDKGRSVAQGGFAVFKATNEAKE